MARQTIDKAEQLEKATTVQTLVGKAETVPAMHLRATVRFDDGNENGVQWAFFTRGAGGTQTVMSISEGPPMPIDIGIYLSAEGLAERTQPYKANVQFDVRLLGNGSEGTRRQLSDEWVTMTNPVPVELAVRAPAVASRCAPIGIVSPARVAAVRGTPLIFAFQANDLEGLPIDHGDEPFYALLEKDGVLQTNESLSVIYASGGRYTIPVRVPSIARYRVRVWLCGERSVQTSDLESTSSCEELPPLTFSSLQLAPGWFRIDNQSVDSRECPIKEACANSDGVERCGAGRTGVYCLKCVEGFYRAGKECVPCEQSSPLLEVLGYPLIIAACIAFFALIPFFIRKAPRFERLSRMSEKAAKHGKRLAVEVMPKVKILVSMYQVLEGIAFVFVIKWPAAFAALLRQITFWSFVFPDLGCNFKLDFRGRLLMRTCVPLGFIAFCAAGWLALRQFADKDKRPKLWNVRNHMLELVFAVVFLFYPSCSAAAFSAFSCEDFEGTRYLKADYSIDCDSPEHASTRAIAGIMIVIYPIGTPLLYLAVLLFNRKAIYAARQKVDDKILNNTLQKTLQEKRRRSTLARTRLAATGGAVAEGNNPLPPAALVAAENAEWATGLFAAGVGSEASDGALGALDNNEIIMATLQFGASSNLPIYVRTLTDSYELKYFWWEIAECLRKVILVGVLVFYDQGSPEQLTLGLMVCTLSVTGYAYTRPYNSPFNDALQVLAQLGIFATLLSSIVLKYDEDDRSSDTMAGILGFLAVAPAVVGIAMVGIEHRRNVKLREARKQRIKDRTTGVEHLRRGSSGLTEVKVEEEAAAARSKREEAAETSKREEAAEEVKVADDVPPATLPPRSTSASLAI